MPGISLTPPLPTDPNAFTKAQRKKLIDQGASPADIDKLQKQLSGAGGMYGTVQDFGKAVDAAPEIPKEPGPGPDLTDKLIHAARSAEILRTKVGKTRKSSFLTGSGVDFSSSFLGG